MKKIFIPLIFLLFFVGCTTEEPVQKPSGITYLVTQLTVAIGQAATTAVPTVTGAAPFTFSIAGVTSVNDAYLQDPNAISINPATGALSIAENNVLPVGEYSIDVAVANAGGSSEFKDVFKFIIQAQLPANLVYNPASLTIQAGIDGTSSQPTLVGDSPFTFTIGNSAALPSFISIDAATGIIALAGSTSMAGEYLVDVEVENSFGTTLFEDVYTITIEPRTVNVSDGYYITKQGEDPVMSAQLPTENVANINFTSQVRDGFFANYVFLTAGDYVIVNVYNKLITEYIGGSTSVVPQSSDCGTQEYTLVSTVVDGNAFTIATEGLYKVTYDKQTAEVILYGITEAGIIGSATDKGWTSSTSLNVETMPSANKAVWQLSGVVLRQGQFKLRFNCNWDIDRRIDAAAGYDQNNGYVLYTNFGGSPGNLLPGFDGGNIDVTAPGGTAPDEGVYTITLTWVPEGGFSMTMDRTADAPPIVFDPTAWNWGIIGSATVENNPNTGWDQDIDLTYQGVTNNVYKWQGIFNLYTTTGDEFKFRTNDVWDYNIGFNDATNTGDMTDISNSNGNYKIANPGNYTIEISTSDDGNSWTVNFTKN